MRAISDSMSNDERSLCDAEICRRVLALDEYKDAKNIFIYVSTNDEVATDELISSMLKNRKNVFVPLCEAGGIMEAVRISDASELHNGLYGIPEPPDFNEHIEPTGLDIIIVPAVAFAEDGSRLGRGGGYYDRYISRAKRVTTIGICRENNLLCTMDTETHDERVDIIVTEKRKIRTLKGAD